METEEKSTGKITTVKQKDPKRVEMGKKLPAMSKAARERKKQLAEAQAIATESNASARSDKWWSYDINYGYLIGFAGLAAALGSLYYSRLEYTRDSTSEHASTSKARASPNGGPALPQGDFIEL